MWKIEFYTIQKKYDLKNWDRFLLLKLGVSLRIFINHGNSQKLSVKFANLQISSHKSLCKNVVNPLQIHDKPQVIEFRYAPERTAPKKNHWLGGKRFFLYLIDDNESLIFNYFVLCLLVVELNDPVYLFPFFNENTHMTTHIHGHRIAIFNEYISCMVIDLMTIQTFICDLHSVFFFYYTLFSWFGFICFVWRSIFKPMVPYSNGFWVIFLKNTLWIPQTSFIWAVLFLDKIYFLCGLMAGSRVCLCHLFNSKCPNR